MGRDDHLFFQADSFAVQEHQRKEMEAVIAGMDGNRLLNTNVDDLISYFAENHRIDVPLLDEANMRVDQRESRRDVSGDPSRMAYFTRQGPMHVTGTELDRRLFRRRLWRLWCVSVPTESAPIRIRATLAHT